MHDVESPRESPLRAARLRAGNSDELREHLNECISAAVLAAWRGERTDQVLRRLLIHVNQRHRFNYILGNGPQPADDEDEEDDEDVQQSMPSDLFDGEDLDNVDLDVTNRVLDQSVNRLRELAQAAGAELRADIEGLDETSDRRVLDEEFEDELDNWLRDDETVRGIADGLMDEMKKRFDLLSGNAKTRTSRTRQGWPVAWEGRWDTDDRDGFLKAISRFSSNHAPRFGRLLTPLVNGMRVAGPFRPTWTDGRRPRFVLLDGEGLGHTPKSSAAVSTSVSGRIEKADAILLVDSATQPMQAAPMAAMREIAATGNARKMILAFTHFDEVKGDNLDTTSARKRHVLESAENVLRAMGEDLGSFAERALRKRIDEAPVFLGGIHKTLQDSRNLRTIRQLKYMVGAIEAVVLASPEPRDDAHPVYDRANLGLAVRAATERFHDEWFPRLGLDQKPGIIKEHWARIKALTRRIATGIADEYDSLKPVASLKTELQNQLYVFIQSPVRWHEDEPPDDDKQAIYDALADNITGRITRLASLRVRQERMPKWQEAYAKRGRGSTFIRAHIVGRDILEPAALAPSAVASRTRNEFLQLVAAEVEAACKTCGARLT